MGAIWLRWGPHLIVLGLVLGVIWFIDHRGYQRAQKDAELERAKTAVAIEEAVAGLEEDLIDAINAQGVQVVETENRIERVERTQVQPVIQKELRNAPHLSDPAAGYGVGLRDAVNAAIEQSARPAAD
ncbi:hypothetical protein [Alteriqipengyuania lutimaris]|uniref:DUF2570 domain-containing protein n=1 Tax=Alteriqipengyuania lutimaris TaxID=1538146 RepID=A0A395LGD8_9SPHN|nr:hypothetical protein [Alteriqipengyuania lutimaris]MBB3035364.1 hypothetical protein [Alteriqipengyuania lutimaris]RDS75948.1 hypothetical protein DL238_14850 [Alteriqipengyuania lutimaris]